MSYSLYVIATNKLVGTISKQQVQILIDLFEEEDTTDQDYYVSKDTLEYMKDKEADPQLIDMLAEHVGDEGVEFEWREEA